MRSQQPRRRRRLPMSWLDICDAGNAHRLGNKRSSSPSIVTIVKHVTPPLWAAATVCLQGNTKKRWLPPPQVLHAWMFLRVNKGVLLNASSFSVCLHRRSYTLLLNKRTAWDAIQKKKKSAWINLGWLYNAAGCASSTCDPSSPVANPKRGRQFYTLSFRTQHDWF